MGDVFTPPTYLLTNIFYFIDSDDRRPVLLSEFHSGYRFPEPAAEEIFHMT